MDLIVLGWTVDANDVEGRWGIDFLRRICTTSYVKSFDRVGIASWNFFFIAVLLLHFSRGFYGVFTMAVSVNRDDTFLAI